MHLSNSTKRTQTETPVASARLTGHTVLVRSNDPYKKPLAVLANHYRTEFSLQKKTSLQEISSVLKSGNVSVTTFGKGGTGGAARPYVTTSKNAHNKRNPAAPVWIVESAAGLKSAVEKALRNQSGRMPVKPILISAPGLKLPEAAKKLFGDVISLKELPEKIKELQQPLQLKGNKLPSRERFLKEFQEEQLKQSALQDNRALARALTTAPAPSKQQTLKPLQHTAPVEPLSFKTPESSRNKNTPTATNSKASYSLNAEKIAAKLKASGVNAVIATDRKELFSLRSELQKSGATEVTPLHFVSTDENGNPIHTVIVPSAKTVPGAEKRADVKQGNALSGVYSPEQTEDKNSVRSEYKTSEFEHSPSQAVEALQVENPLQRFPELEQKELLAFELKVEESRTLAGKEAAVQTDEMLDLSREAFPALRADTGDRTQIENPAALLSLEEVSFPPFSGVNASQRREALPKKAGQLKQFAPEPEEQALEIADGPSESATAFKAQKRLLAA